MTIEDHFYLYAALAGVSITKNNIFEMLDSFNLADLKLDAKISDLSSGEKQRIAILLSTLKQPDILILDEPTSSLDKENAIAILEYIQNYVKRRNIKAVMAFHDPICSNYISSVYKIEKTKILKENSRAISEKYDKNNKVSIKKSLSFYYSYFKNSLHYNFKRILFIILSIALGIGTGNFMNAFTNGIENTKIKLISDSFSKELLICKNNINELENKKIGVVDINGEDLAVLIGKKGITLDSFQYINVNE